MAIDPGLFIPTRNFVDNQLPTLTNNYYTVAGIGAFNVRLIQIPKSGVITPPSSTDAIVVQEINPSTEAVIRTFTIITSGTPTTNQVLVDSTAYTMGTLGFSAQTPGILLKFIYQGIGSTLFALDINTITSGSLLKDGCIASRHLTNITSLSLSGNLSVGGTLTLNGSLTLPGALRISGSSLLYLGKLSTDPTPSSANVGAIYYCNADKQFKGIADGATPGTYLVQILG